MSCCDGLGGWGDGTGELRERRNFPEGRRTEDRANRWRKFSIQGEHGVDARGKTPGWTGEGEAGDRCESKPQGAKEEAMGKGENHGRLQQGGSCH